MSPLCQAALTLGVPVFPCAADKAPLVQGGFKSATADRDEIIRMFAHPQAAAIGMPTGPRTGIWVVDIDVREERNGMAWLDANHDALPPTRKHRTRSGGVHLVFAWNAQHPVRNSASRIANGVDVRGDGGFVIVPPTPGYEVLSDAPVAHAPQWLLTAAKAPGAVLQPKELLRGPGPIQERLRGRLARSYAAVAHAGEGSRNDTLNREAFLLSLLVKDGLLDRDTVYAEMCHAAFRAGLPQPEVRATLHSAMSAAGV